MEILSYASAEKKTKRRKGLKFGTSNDTMAVKGLITTLDNFIDLRLQLSN